MTGAGRVDPDAELGARETRRARRSVARTDRLPVAITPMSTATPVGQGGSPRLPRAYGILRIQRRAPAMTTAFPDLSAIRRSPKPRPAVGRRAILGLTDREASHVARFPLTLTDAQGGRIVIPAGTGDGDQLVLHDRGGLIVLRVRVHERLDSP